MTVGVGHFCGGRGLKAEHVRARDIGGQDEHEVSFFSLFLNYGKSTALQAFCLCVAFQYSFEPQFSFPHIHCEPFLVALTIFCVYQRQTHYTHGFSISLYPKRSQLPIVYYFKAIDYNLSWYISFNSHKIPQMTCSNLIQFFFIFKELFYIKPALS